MSGQWFDGRSWNVQVHSTSCPHLWCQRLAQLVECGGGGELEIGLLIELVRPDVPIGRGRGRSCEVGRGGG